MDSEIDERQVARLAEFHDRPERAALRGPSEVATSVWASPPQGVGIHEIDKDKIIRRVHSEELRLLGYREDQMVGHACWEFIVMQETSIRAIEQKLSGARELKPFVRTFLIVDGRPVTLLLLDRHMSNATGIITGLRTAMTGAHLTPAPAAG